MVTALGTQEGGLGDGQVQRVLDRLEVLCTAARGAAAAAAASVTTAATQVPKMPAQNARLATSAADAVHELPPLGGQPGSGQSLQTVKAHWHATGTSRDWLLTGCCRCTAGRGLSHGEAGQTLCNSTHRPIQNAPLEGLCLEGALPAAACLSCAAMAAP
jgi:hypothetical protein